MKINEKQQSHRPSDHHHSWWHSSLFGYPLAVVLTACASLIPLSYKYMGIPDYFVEPPFILATLLIGWIWGLGPALLALLLGMLAIDYWLEPPPGVISFFRWPDIASFAPLVISLLVALGFVISQKNYRRQLLQANQAIVQQAEQLAESNARLEQADQVKDRFLSMASHELRTPVTSIQGYVQLLLRRFKKQNAQNPELLPVCDSLEKVDEQARRLVSLMNDLLDINSLRLGKMPFRLAPCDLCLLCREIVEEQQALAGRLINVLLPAEPLMVQADKERLSQVLLNLVSNACKYSPEQTTITVEIQQKPELAVITVHNTGPILAKEQQEAIFEPFYRSAEAHVSSQSGWGLGLAISKEIVEQHHGKIWVESSEEKGTTFFVVLPLFLEEMSQTR